MAASCMHQLMYGGTGELPVVIDEVWCHVSVGVPMSSYSSGNFRKVGVHIFRTLEGFSNFTKVARATSARCEE